MTRQDDHRSPAPRASPSAGSEANSGSRRRKPIENFASDSPPLADGPHCPGVRVRVRASEDDDPCDAAGFDGSNQTAHRATAPFFVTRKMAPIPRKSASDPRESAEDSSVTMSASIHADDPAAPPVT